MTVFVDTSGFLALLDGDDSNHDAAVQAWDLIQRRGDKLVTTNYVVLESISIIHRRSGIDNVRRFQNDLLSVASVEWVRPHLHFAAVSALMAGSRRDPSLVDRVSFEVMSRQGISRALAFDRHYIEQGYSLPA